MTYKDLFDAYYEFRKNEDIPNGTFIRPHAFVAGAKWVIECLYTIPIDEVVSEMVELHEKLKQEENLTKWDLKKMSLFVPNKCESCDRFDECYTNGRMRRFCEMYGLNTVFKFKDNGN